MYKLRVLLVLLLAALARPQDPQGPAQGPDAQPLIQEPAPPPAQGPDAKEPAQGPAQGPDAPGPAQGPAQAPASGSRGPGSPGQGRLPGPPSSRPSQPDSSSTLRALAVRLEAASRQLRQQNARLAQLEARAAEDRAAITQLLANASRADRLELQLETLKSLVSEQQVEFGAWSARVDAHVLQQAAINEAVDRHLDEHGGIITEIAGGRPSRLPSSCADLLRMGQHEDGVYTVYLDRNASRPVRLPCDMTTRRGGWTVFQQRFDGSVDFYRNWTEYKNGFGDPEGEFWLGNEALWVIAGQEQHVLRVELEEFGNDQVYWQEFKPIIMLGETEMYKIKSPWSQVTSSGSAGNSMIQWHFNTPFSTYDSDNDYLKGSNCAVSYHGGWWYNICHAANLNGQYFSESTSPFGMGLNWSSLRGYRNSMRTTRMMVRPLAPPAHSEGGENLLD